jgi:hypothetical protein
MLAFSIVSVRGLGCLRFKQKLLFFTERVEDRSVCDGLGRRKVGLPLFGVTPFAVACSIIVKPMSRCKVRMTNIRRISAVAA